MSRDFVFFSSSSRDTKCETTSVVSRGIPCTSTMAAATPPFPKNGPGERPTFDGVELLLMDRATPPETLMAHMERLGNEETSASVGGVDILDTWPTTTPELEQLLSVESISSWDYDLTGLNAVTGGRPLAVLAFALIDSFGLIKTLDVDPLKLKRYLLKMERTYNPCMYHNPLHGADVMHAFCYLLRNEKISSAIPAEELLVAILAGPSHDLGHPGVNNALLIKQKHPISVQYPTSVLESHHAALALNFLQDPDVDVLSFLDNDPTRKQELRQYMKDLVLYTDMSLHGKIMERLTELGNDKSCLNLSDAEDRKCAMQTLLHAADLSNPCKKWEIHVQWTHAIVAEFFSQGDLERHLGIDVTPMLDRTINCGRTSQKGFFVHFIRPLFILCAKTLPVLKETCDMLVEKLDANVARWTELGF